MAPVLNDYLVNILYSLFSVPAEVSSQKGGVVPTIKPHLLRHTSPAGYVTSYDSLSELERMILRSSREGSALLVLTFNTDL